MPGLKTLQKYKLAKKSLVLFIAACLLFSFLAPDYIFFLRQKAIRKEIKQQIKKGVQEKDMFVFRIDNISGSRTFKWINDHEFIYEGNLYDIVKQENGIVFCINDHQEELLFKNLDQLSRKRMNDSEMNKKALSLYFLPSEADYSFSINIYGLPVFPDMVRKPLSHHYSFFIPPESNLS